MSTVVSVWSRVLHPGQDALISEDVSIQITNITLEFLEPEEPSSMSALTTARSVVKMQHLEAEPALLRAAAGYEFGSDSEDESDSEMDSEEEDEEDGLTAVADSSKISKGLASSTAAARKSASHSTNGLVNGTDPKQSGKGIDDNDVDEDEDEAEDEDDDEFDEDDIERKETEIQICSLLPGVVEQVQTNVILPAGEDFVMKLSGAHNVHLFGHYIVQPRPRSFDDPPYGSEGAYDSDEITSNEGDDLSEGEMGEFDPKTGLPMFGYDSDDDDDKEDEDSRFMEIVDDKSPAKKSKKAITGAAVPTNGLSSSTKPGKKADTAPTPAPTPASAAIASEITDKSKLSKNQLKKLAKKEKAGSAATVGSQTESATPSLPAASVPVPAPAAGAAEGLKDSKPTAIASAKKTPSKKQTLPSGLVYEDNKTGTGAAAKDGQRVQMRYIGRLQNGKIFDQNTKGTPFSFKLGKGEVIKGWDQGIAGMQVGGERRLTIPPTLAYGKQAISGIPANSTLTFEVKLLSIK